MSDAEIETGSSLYLILFCHFRCSIDLNSLEKEQTHYLEAELEDKAGFVCLYLTVTALCASGSESDLDTVHRETDSKRNEQVQQYSLIKTFKAVDEIGWLQVIVIGLSNRIILLRTELLNRAKLSYIAFYAVKDARSCLLLNSFVCYGPYNVLQQGFNVYCV